MVRCMLVASEAKAGTRMGRVPLDMKIRGGRGPDGSGASAGAVLCPLTGLPLVAWLRSPVEGLRLAAWLNCWSRKLTGKLAWKPELLAALLGALLEGAVTGLEAVLMAWEPLTAC